MLVILVLNLQVQPILLLMGGAVGFEVYLDDLDTRVQSRLLSRVPITKRLVYS
jgi:hypothetical protein